MNREYLDLVQRACVTLLKIPGVFSVGLGSKVTGGRNTGQLALSIMVLEKKPRAAITPGDVIPDEVEGLPTDVVEGQPPHLIQDDEDEDLDFDTGIPLDEGLYRPVVGGIRIRGGRSRIRNGAPTFGTLGCFAKTTGKDAGQRVLLTNHHVLADDIGELHGPSCTGCTKGDFVGNPNSGDQIATVLRGKDDVRMDAAIAILDEGVEFQRDIVKDDELPPHRAAIGEPRVLDPTNPADRDFIAHKRGHRTRVTYGNVGAIEALVIAGKRKERQIRIDLPEKISGANLVFQGDHTLLSPDVDFIAAGVQRNDVAWIESNVNRGRFRINEVRQHEIDLAGKKLAPGPPGLSGLFVTPPNFALRGDSGSVLLDGQGRVIGLIWAARSSRRGNAWATPIDVIEAGLRIKIDAATAIGDTQVARIAGDGLSDNAIIEPERLRPAAAVAEGDAVPPVTLRERVEQDLIALPRGREIHDLYFRHHLEVRDLLDSNDRVAKVWHRQCGPAIIQSVLDAVRSRETAIPSTIRGKSWADRVKAILTVFAEHGSLRLRHDVISFGNEVAGLAGFTYPQLLKSFGK